MINERLNGDIYFCNVRIYNGKRQAPVRWVMLLITLVGFAAFMVFLTVWLSV